MFSRFSSLRVAKRRQRHRTMTHIWFVTSDLTLSGKFPARRVGELKGRTGKDKILVQKEESRMPGGRKDEVILALQKVPVLRSAPLPKAFTRVLILRSGEDKQISKDPGWAEFRVGIDIQVQVRPWLTKPSQALNFKIMVKFCCDYFQRKRKTKRGNNALNVLSSSQKISLAVGKGQI